MFASIDESLNVFIEEMKKFQFEIKAEDERISSILIDARVENSTLSPDIIQNEINVLIYKEQLIHAFAQQAAIIRKELSDLTTSFESTSIDKAEILPASHEEGKGWFGKIMGYQKTIIHNDPIIEEDSNEKQKFYEAVQERLAALNLLVTQLEERVDITNSSLRNWIFEFKERVVNLSMQDPHKYRMDISLYESLVSNFTYYLNLHGHGPFKLTSIPVDNDINIDNSEFEMELSNALDDTFSSNVSL